MEILEQYVVVLVMAICFGIGIVLKRAFDKLPNKYIPLILAALGILLNCWINGGAFTPEILVGGLASGLLAVGMFEFGKQLLSNIIGKGGGGTHG
ncbi:MAG TPA: holin [Clostridiales bacterium]|nr:holin [Clostridiales bacterium]